MAKSRHGTRYSMPWCVCRPQSLPWHEQTNLSRHSRHPWLSGRRSLFITGKQQYGWTGWHELSTASETWSNRTISRAIVVFAAATQRWDAKLQHCCLGDMMFQAMQ